MLNGQTVWAGIFARGGSKGVLKKNLRKINGVSLIERAVKKALATPSVDRVFVSTDCPDIQQKAIQAGAEAPFLRPAELATDDAAELQSWRHMVQYWQTIIGEVPDVFVSIPTVCPLGLPEDIEKTIFALIDSAADIALTVTEDTSREAFLTGKLGADNRFSFLMERTAHRRQDFPEIYKIIALCYATYPAYILATNDITKGHVKGVTIPQERSLDIDTEFDFKLAAFLLET